MRQRRRLTDDYSGDIIPDRGATPPGIGNQFICAIEFEPFETTGLAMPRFPSSRLQSLTRLCLFSAGLLLLASAAAPALTPEPSPQDVIRHLYSELLDTMQHAATLGLKGRYEKLQPLIFGTFDVPFMARLTIGPIWYQLSPEQKYQAAQAYGSYITAIYANRFDGYAGEKLQVLGDRKVPHGLVVTTQIVKSDGDPVTLDYLVHDNVIGWQIRDVYETGTISQLATQRSDFSGFLRSGGIEGLIATLNKKTVDLLKP
jgi:phospholipid transport system substrate-binding protein